MLQLRYLSFTGLLLAIASFPFAGEHSPQPVRFTDITDSAGIQFRHNSAPDKKYIVESMSGGVALFDFDNDGYLDIYFTNSPTVDTAADPRSAPCALYRNNRDGTFSDVTEKSGLTYPGWAMGAVAADFDDDGDQDLYVTCFGPNHLYRNNGGGRFEDITDQVGIDDPRWSAGAAFGDYDKDGILDLFVANYVDFKLSDLPSFGKGKFCLYRGIPVQCGPRGLLGAGDSLFRGSGAGTFTNVSEKAGVSDLDKRFGLGVVWTDFDHDSWVDLFVVNDSGPNFLYHNKHDGTFEEIGVGAGVAFGDDGQELGNMGIAIGDYLHNGWFGIFVTHFSEEYDTLFRQDSKRLFSDVSYAAKVAAVSIPNVGWGTAFFDYDNDGWPDLLTVNGHVYPQVGSLQGGPGYAQRILLHHNERNGSFSEVAAQHGDALLVPRVSRGAAFGDIDNDGDIDVVINNLDGKPLILRNDGGNQNNWVTLQLLSGHRNHNALGARVKVVAADLVQWDEIRSGGSYLSSNDLQLHFGLEKRSQVNLIEVHWPDGKIETVRDIPVNQFLVIEEEKGLVRSRTVVHYQDAK